MQRVNIPLSRHRKTTRPSRRVVFVSGWILVCICLSAWVVSDFWFQRITIDSAAPVGTFALIEFQQTRGNADLLHEILGDLPLISNRPVTYRDLAPYIAGEFGVFLHTNGYSVALRPHTPIPEEVVHAWGVEQTSTENEVILLSEHLPAITGVETELTLFDRFPRILSRRIGSFSLIENDSVSTSIIRSNRRTLTTTVKTPSFFGPTPKPVPNSIGHLSTLPWPSTDNLPTSWSHLLSSFLPSNVFSDERAIVYLSQADRESDEHMISTLVVLKERDLISDDIEQFLRVFGALSQPKQVPVALADGTGMRELIADPSSVSVETTSVLGLSAKRALLDNQSFLAATLLPDGGVALTNSEELLSQFLNKESLNEDNCQEAPFFLSIDRFNQFLNLEQEYYRPLLTSYIGSHFSTLSIDGDKKTKISLCKR